MKNLKGLGKVLNKKEQKEINGGTFFHAQTSQGVWCRYNCNGNTARLNGGGSQCTLYLPYIVYNHPTCNNFSGGGGGGINTGGSINRPEVWA